MANKNFDAATPYMDNSVVAVTNGIWEVELFKADTGDFQVRFAKGYLSSFASLADSGAFSVFITGAGKLPDYVLGLALRMYHDNVPA